MNSAFRLSNPRMASQSGQIPPTTRVEEASRIAKGSFKDFGKALANRHDIPAIEALSVSGVAHGPIPSTQAASGMGEIRCQPRQALSQGLDVKFKVSDVLHPAS